MKRLLLLSSAFLLLAAPALAAGPGDVVRAIWSDPYLLNSASTRMVFPDQVTVETWGNPAATQLDAPQLAQWTLSGAMPIRAGSKLVKFGNDPQVYAVGPNGTLHWIESETLAEQLYGSSWNRKVVSLFPSYFPIYTVGEPVAVPHHPDGTLLKYADDPTVYYVINGQARAIADEAAFKANRFSFDNVIVVPRSFVYPPGARITGWEQDLDPASAAI